MEPITVAPPTTTEETVKKSDLDQLIQRFEKHVDTAVDAAIQKALEKYDLRMDEKLATVKGEIRGELNTRLTDHAEQERNQRQKDIEALQTQLQSIGDLTGTKISEFGNKVDNAIKSVESLDSQVGRWTNSLDANQKLYEDNRRDIANQSQKMDSVQRDVNNLAETQVKTVERLKGLHGAVHGGEDGRKSLFARQDDLENSIKKMFAEFQLQLTPALELARSTANRQDQIEQSWKEEKDALEKQHQEKKERWSKRYKAGTDIAKSLLQNRWFQGFLILVTVGTLTAIRPEIAGILANLVTQIFYPTQP